MSLHFANRVVREQWSKSAGDGHFSACLFEIPVPMFQLCLVPKPGRHAQKWRRLLKLKPKFLTAIAAIALGFSTPVVAQQSDAQQGEVPSIAAEDVTETQVNAFVDAALAVQDVQNEYMPKIQATEDETKRNEIIEEANTAAASAVESVEELTIDDYLAISEAARQDEDLNARIMARLQSEQEE